MQRSICAVLWLLALPLSSPAQLRSGDVVVLAPTLSAAGVREAVDLAGANAGQCSAVGLAASGTAEGAISAGFWPADGGPIAAAACAGDCNGDRRVTVDELVRAVNIALGNLAAGECLPIDTNGDAFVSIDELVRAVRNALEGCSGGAALSLPPRGGSPVPVAFSLQGKLPMSSSGGNDESVALDVAIWDRSSGGTLLYRERHPATPLTNGLFNVMIGGGADRSDRLDAGLFAGDDRWLELSIDGRPLPTREPLGTLAYAFRADTAAHAATAETAVGMEVGQPVSAAGGTFTGPVAFGSAGGQDLVRLGAAPGRPDHGMVAIGDGQNGDLVRMLVDAEGAGELAMLDSQGRELASVESVAVDDGLATRRARAPRAGRVVVRGPNGALNAQMREARDNPDHGLVTVHDEDGSERAEIGVDATGGGRLRASGAGVAGPIRAELIGNDGVVQVLDETGFFDVARLTSVGNEEFDPAAANRGTVLVRASALAPRGAEMLAGPRGEGMFRAYGPNRSLNVEIGASGGDPNRGRLSIYDEMAVEKVVAEAGADRTGTVEVADAQGRVRATLDGSGLVAARSAESGQGAFLGFAEDSTERGRIGVGDPDNGTFCQLYVDSGGRGRLAVNDLGGREVARLGVVSDPGLGAVETRGPNGQQIVVLNAAASNAEHGFLAVRTADGESRVQLYAAADGSGRAVVINNAEKIRAQFQILQGAGLLETRGPNGQPNVVLSAREEHPDSGFVSVRNAAGEIRGQMHLVFNEQGRLELFGPAGGSTVTATSGSGTPNDGLLYLNAGEASMSSDSIQADLKNFVVDHPEQPGKKIIYAALEGPEAAMYHRGVARLTDGGGEIVLPDHFVALASPGTITVQLTPGSADSRGVGFDAIEDGRIEIGELHGGSGSYGVHFVVHAVRRGHEDYRPVVDAEAVEARGAGRAVVSETPAQIEASRDVERSIDEPEALVEPARSAGTTHGRQS